jgi:hypothetical protein
LTGLIIKRGWEGQKKKKRLEGRFFIFIELAQ